MLEPRSSTITAASANRRRPPDYTSRRVKLRLFVTLASIMLVATLVERILTRSKQPPGPPDTPFNNRLQNQPRTANDPAGTFVAEPESPSAAAANDKAEFNPVQRAVQQQWTDSFSRLTAEERDELIRLIDLADHRHLVRPPEKNAINQLLRTIEQYGEESEATAQRSLSELPESDRAKWIAVLEHAQERYREGVGTLAHIADREHVDADEQSRLEDLRSALVAIARGQIQDDTPILRPAERQIWFHEFARIAERPAVASSDDEGPLVGYLQLARQPGDYRGKLVTIKGSVRRAYRSAAGENILGITEYCVYWLYPAGGPDAPVVVYALAAPPGFPSLAKNAQVARNNLCEDVEITGVFFKRCAYAGQGGTYTAPLLVANTPVWHPSPEPFSAAPSPNLAYELGGVALSALVLAICVTAVLWKRSASARARAQSLTASSLVDLSRIPTTTSPGEYFRHLDQQQGGGK